MSRVIWSVGGGVHRNGAVVRQGAQDFRGFAVARVFAVIGNDPDGVGIGLDGRQMVGADLAGSLDIILQGVGDHGDGGKQGRKHWFPEIKNISGITSTSSPRRRSSPRAVPP